MKKEFEFTVKGHQIRVVNRWLRASKLYVDGDFRDQDTTLFAFGREVLLSAKLGEHGILEVCPRSESFSVEIDAYLTPHNSPNKPKKIRVYSSHERLSLPQRRAAQ